ncbi:MAG: 1-acyl-sn-glycerol-3-phosphate acyltransferase, partial [Spirochaetaceae bacterium]|nr:1-acyl-sn-glycerol-3-phosphate acyltransferase [Spirochaetaceae bacterium]
MKSQSLNVAYKDLIQEIIASAHIATHINPDNVYQQGEPKTLAIFDKMITDLLLPGSEIRGWEHIVNLYEKAQGGASCLLFLEHYGNMDLPGISYLLRKRGPLGEKIAAALVAIAGRKLNEENPGVAAFAGAFTRIVLCQSRYINSEKDI